MNPSTFDALYPFVRTLLGDIYTVASYSNDQIDLGIRMGLLQEDVYTEVAMVSPSGDRTIDPPVQKKLDQLRVSVRAALALIRPASDEGSYRTPMLSVSTRTNISYQDLKTLLKTIVDGDMNICVSDNEFDQAFAGITTIPALLARFGITQSTLTNWGNNQQAFPNG